MNVVIYFDFWRGWNSIRIWLASNSELQFGSNAHILIFVLAYAIYEPRRVIGRPHKLTNCDTSHSYQSQLTAV